MSKHIEKDSDWNLNQDEMFGSVINGLENHACFACLNSAHPHLSPTHYLEILSFLCQLFKMCNLWDSTLMQPRISDVWQKRKQNGLVIQRNLVFIKAQIQMTLLFSKHISQLSDRLCILGWFVELRFMSHCFLKTLFTLSCLCMQLYISHKT